MNWKKQQEILSLQWSAPSIRNVSILAHVDHGKTSLSDSLLSSNQIISAKLAGKLRFLDSRPDEQERCITMKASSISLTFNSHLINIIDSPGHVDFSSEVAAALRVCDGGILVVDACEGIAPQTYTVLKQSWQEGVKLCLVLNKVDRLILELKMEPVEAYNHLSSIVEGINAIVSNFYAERAHKQGGGGAEGQEQHMFYPESGNVAFCSSLDRWAFTLVDIAKFYAAKMGFNAKSLCRSLWGEFYFTKNKTVQKKPPSDKAKQMFVQFVLEPLWKVYQCTVMEPSTERLQKMLGVVEVTLSAKEMANPDAKALLQTVMTAWMPLDRAVLGMVIRNLPSPLDAQALKQSIICPEIKGDLLEAFKACDRDGPVTCFVSKMMSVDPVVHISRTPGQPLGQHDTLIGLGRVYSGTLEAGSIVYVIQNTGGVMECLITHLYLVMGQYLVPISKAPAGNIVAIGGLQSLMIKSATISSSPDCQSFSPLSIKATPIVKVAVQPVNVEDMQRLTQGLALLNRSDNSVEVYVDQNGQNILAVCGEVHLQRCVKDLEETFACVPIQVSDPIVSFKETLADGWVCVEDVTPNGRCRIKATAFALPEQVTNFIDSKSALIKRIYGAVKQQADRETFNNEFAGIIQDCPQADLILSNLQAFGPRQCGNNILVHVGRESLLLRERREETDSDSENGSTSNSRLSTQEVNLGSALVAGFDIASNSGPLCGEPLHGVCIVIQEVVIASSEEAKDPYGPFHGQVISTMKDVCRSAVMANGPRLVEGMYNCNFQTTQDHIGRLYQVLNKRRGKIREEILQEGSNQFVCQALLPVAESFGFSDELRSVTSGAVVPQLVFANWQIIPVDPFAVATTEKELEENGTQPQLENLPKRYMKMVRNRKGLPTDEKLVVSAEKQRTLTKNK